MSGVFQNIDPHPPTPPAAQRVCTPSPLWCGGEDTLDGWRGGWGVNILEDARHSSVLYMCKYFVTRFFILIPEGQASYNQSWSYLFSLKCTLFFPRKTKKISPDLKCELVYYLKALASSGRNLY
jgi:hypothetical protein